MSDTVAAIAEILERHFPGAPSKSWLGASGELAAFMTAAEHSAPEPSVSAEKERLERVRNLLHEHGVIETYSGLLGSVLRCRQCGEVPGVTTLDALRRHDLDVLSQLGLLGLSPAPQENWNPNTSGPNCDWCGECEWCLDLGRASSLPPAPTTEES